MENQRESDMRTVASKLPTGEFANFKKLCDIENKTPSRKVRELINQEVNNKFGNIYKSRYDKEKIKQFEESAIQEYERSKVVDDICKVNLVERTDGKFTQIGSRPLIDEQIFLEDKEGTHFHPELPGIGRDVAVGERDFLIKTILDNKNVQKKIIKKDEIKDFPKYAFDFQKATILISTEFFVGLHQKFMNRIKYDDNKTVLDSNYILDFVPSKIMDNRIIIIEEDAILWAKQKFKNEFTEKDEALDIGIEPRIGGKVDIIVRSVNRIKSLDVEGIKILEVEE